MSPSEVIPNVSRVKPLPLTAGFLPLIVFVAMSARVADNGAAWAALVALAVAVAAMWFEQPRHPVRILTLIQAGLLVLVAVIGFTGGFAVDRWLFDWGSGVVTLAIGLLILATAPVVPVTEQCARLNTSRAYWSSPTFKLINRMLSATWGAALTAIGLASILAATIDARAASADSVYLADLVLNWIAPIAILCFLIRFTAVYPDRVTGADSSARSAACHAAGTDDDVAGRQSGLA